MRHKFIITIQPTAALILVGGPCISMSLLVGSSANPRLRGDDAGNELNSYQIIIDDEAGGLVARIQVRHLYHTKITAQHSN